MQYRDQYDSTISAKCRRAAPRFLTKLPIYIGHCEGSARNISANGMYIDVGVALVAGCRVVLTLAMNVRGQRLKVACEGEVIRVDQEEGRFGIATKLREPFFSTTPDLIAFNVGSLIADDEYLETIL